MHYVKPALAITLGLTATRAVTGVAGSMRDVHGTIHTAGTMRVLATYHPAAALRGGKAVEALLRADVRKAGTLLSP